MTRDWEPLLVFPLFSPWRNSYYPSFLLKCSLFSFCIRKILCQPVRQPLLLLDAELMFFAERYPKHNMLN